MNKLFVAVFVVAIGASYGLFLDSLPKLPSLPGTCKKERDCGAHRCCFRSMFCVPKVGGNGLCGTITNLTGCGCREGLECKITRVITLVTGDKKRSVKFGRCRAPEEIVVPEEINYDTEAVRHKRFQLPSITGITSAIGGAVSGVVDKFFRKCSSADQHNCGDNRCCARAGLFGFRCFPTLGENMPCGVLTPGHCCDKGLECRSKIILTVGSPDSGSPPKKIIDAKFCTKISEAVEPPTELEVDE